MAKTIVIDNPTKFSKIESFTQNQPDLQSDFEIKIWNVPLDIEKDLFEQHLRSLGQVKKIKFVVKNLYYEVSVTFANKDLASALKEEWSMKFLNKTFRIFPSTLIKKERNHRFKHILKLTNLPKGINRGNLLEIVTIDNMNAVKENHFVFNNKGLHFADKNALTCYIYGSINNKVRNCPENIEAPKPKSGFKPIFPPAKKDFFPSDMNWADDWDAKFLAKLTPPVSYAKNKTGFNSKSNRVLSKDIPSNISQSQVTDSFINAFNKRSRIDEDVSDTNAMEHNHNPTVQRMDEIEDKVNNACSSLETMNNRLGQLIGLFSPFNAYLSQQDTNPLPPNNQQ
ncbi:hypothetical protein RclHR1_05580003 [Rhizophagus clarus]|uniref:RRM domain-containing protein n=1 Tax=Rhizophagus clarus TaxID=94130 RepID=A0A2Z6RMQ8_9GLOM|nr:hypothetical protein RclHR1_05580003 [Rhizophagus clarus]